jgi:pSer/pThr/pTyr-binding forkhead associated (FHA) protein
MTGLLLVTFGPDQGRSFPLAEGQTLRIGRGKDSDTHLTDPRVGRVHCQVEFRDGKVVLSDCGSTGGTRVNGKPVTRHELQPGDAIRIGDSQLWFRLVAPEELATATDLPPVKP